MKKIRTEVKENIPTFFEIEISAENQKLDSVDRSEISQTEGVTPNSLLSLIKQIFLFLPGTFLLYLIGFIGTIILISSLYAQESLEIFGISSAPLQLFVFAIIALFGTFMTWFGLGDIRNKNHLSIPISILATGGILALISKILGDVLGFTGLFEMMNYYFIYLFPLVLIVPILVKGWVDRKMEDS